MSLPLLRPPAAATVDPYALGREGLRELLADQPAFRAEQVHRWLVRGVDDPAAMTDLPLELRQRLTELLDPPPKILRRSTADDGLTHKVLLQMSSGEAVESVLMLYPRRDHRAKPRATVCISTQAGCAMGCPFCATGQAGFRGQLGLGEVVRQVTVMQRLLQDDDVAPATSARSQERTADVPDHVTNVVFMGMGEPLANLATTVAAVRWLHDDFGLSARSITVSTVGLVPGIRRLTKLGLPITLAVSLHAPNDELRDLLVPVNRQHPLAELLAASHDYLLATGRRLTFEYVLIGGINDARRHAEQLAELVGSVPQVHVNLIPMNPTPAVPWRAPGRDVQEAFAAVLTGAGISTTIRRNRGGEIDAACGQLYADYAVASGRMLPSAVGAADRVQRSAAADDPRAGRGQPSSPGPMRR